MLRGKYLIAKEAYDRTAAPLDEDTADMTDICLATHPPSKM